MTIVPPVPGEPRRPDGPRDPGDAWVIADDGTRYWGRFGAAGLLAYDPLRGILMQQRVGWSHFGGTWGIPGGARHQGEDAVTGALRESAEEAGVPADAVTPLFQHVLDRAVWTYTTIAVQATTPFDPVIGDPESDALAWVPIDEVDALPLHPGFADAWPALRSALHAQPVLVVDAANVVGSKPDGWWRDRAGATERLRDELVALRLAGIRADALGLQLDRWFPSIELVVEGDARGVASAHGVDLIAADATGDDAIVERVRAHAGAPVIVVTSDRELQARAEGHGATVHGSGWLRDLL